MGPGVGGGGQCPIDRNNPDVFFSFSSALNLFYKGNSVFVSKKIIIGLVSRMGPTFSEC